MAGMTKVEVAVYNIASAAFARERGTQVVLVCEDPECKWHIFGMFCRIEDSPGKCEICGKKLKIKQSVPAI
jgi:hypothetical protein